jgi:tetraacyldisaccharide 4'-kinase
VKPSWLQLRDESLLQRIVRAPLLPLGWGYGAAAAAHRLAYDHGLRPKRELPGHVISVGNLVVGGTGKTPFAAWLAASLHRRGRKVALASRGYGRAGNEPVSVVSDGRHVLGRAETAGDEPMLLAAHAPGVPVLVGPDRGRVGLRALSQFGTEVLVLDDGFQHHRLHRDVDLVCFDGRLGLGNGHVLPRGPLREPVGALRRADAVCILDGPLPEDDVKTLLRIAPSARRVRIRRRPTTLRPLAGGASGDPASLQGLEVGLLAALAQPRSFRRTLEALGASVVAERIFKDHHAYRYQDVSDLAKQAPLWITTEKDAVKIVPSWIGSAEVRVLGLRLEVEDAHGFVDWVESRLR